MNIKLESGRSIESADIKKFFFSHGGKDSFHIGSEVVERPASHCLLLTMEKEEIALFDSEAVEILKILSKN
jgi:hypothetical protein